MEHTQQVNNGINSSLKGGSLRLTFALLCHVKRLKFGNARADQESLRNESFLWLSQGA